MTRIFIIGYMGVGKTTVGKKLANFFSLTFIDLDCYIQARQHKTIPQLFEQMGEEGFRRIEQQTLQEVAGFENVVISTGGGTPCFFDNMNVMKQAGTTLYIEASPEVLAERLLLSKSARPLIAGKTKEELLAFVTRHLDSRRQYYEQAHLVFNVDQMLTKAEIEDKIENIANKLQTFFKNNCSKNSVEE